MFLLIDNYDSFTYNLVQAFQKHGNSPEVLRNDNEELLELAKGRQLEKVCISPGPGRPESAGLCLKFLELLPPEVPVLGVCLGHQILSSFAGADIVIAGRIMHGKSSQIEHTNEGIFKGMPRYLQAGRYHSLVADLADASEKTKKLLKVTAKTNQDEIMGIMYTDRPWQGVQFHPESVLTPQGEELLKQF